MTEERRPARYYEDQFRFSPSGRRQLAPPPLPEEPADESPSP